MANQTLQRKTLDRWLRHKGKIAFVVALFVNYVRHQNPTRLNYRFPAMIIHALLSICRRLPLMMLGRLVGYKDSMHPIGLSDAAFLMLLRSVCDFGNHVAVNQGLNTLVVTQRLMLSFRRESFNESEIYFGIGSPLLRRDAVWVTRGQGKGCPLGSIPVIFWTHGGGYTAGSASMYLLTFNRLLAHLERHGIVAGVLSIEYPLSPDAPYPIGLEFSTRIYEEIVHNLKLVKPEHLILAGDSAGGAMAVSIAARIRRQTGCSPAAGMLLLSPWVSHDVDSRSHSAYQHIDIIGGASLLRKYSDMYTAHHDKDHHEISVVNHPELDGLPKTFVLAGEREVFVDDILRFVQVAKSYNVDIDVDVAPNMVHVYPCLTPFMPKPVKRGIKLMASVCADMFKSVDHKLVPPM